MFELARKSSVLMSLSLQIEHQLTKRFRSETPVELAVFRFREDYDVPQVSVFSHSVPNYLRFERITCVAVILQFDYKVVRKIPDLGESLKSMNR